MCHAQLNFDIKGDSLFCQKIHLVETFSFSAFLQLHARLNRAVLAGQAERVQAAVYHRPDGEAHEADSPVPGEARCSA